MSNVIPVVLFAYSRPDHLKRTLSCLRENNIPLLYAFSDAPKTPDSAERVNEVRQILHEIDWCEVHLVERKENLGLGKSILSGVTEILQKHEAIIVFEDDLICVPGTYQYLCSALEQYKDDTRVMSVTGWTHPLITPDDITNQPYFDGRAECWVWGTWARAWQGMTTDAKTLMMQCENQGIDIYYYGADLVAMAKVELHQNIWAVRFIFWHILNRAVCLRPPWSMVEHIGFGDEATNAKNVPWLKSQPLMPCPPIPLIWPEPGQIADCGPLHQKVCGIRPTLGGELKKLVLRAVSKILGLFSAR